MGSEELSCDGGRFVSRLFSTCSAVKSRGEKSSPRGDAAAGVRRSTMGRAAPFQLCATFQTYLKLTAFYSNFQVYLKFSTFAEEFQLHLA